MEDKRILEVVSRFSDSYEPVLMPDDVPQTLLDTAGQDVLRRAHCESGQQRKRRTGRIALAACVATAFVAAGLILWLPRTTDGSHQAVSATGTASTVPMNTALPSAGVIIAKSGDGQIIARSYTGELPMSASMMDIRGLASDEIFNEYDTAIFRGTITDIQYIEIVAQESTPDGVELTLLDYYGIVSVDVASSVRGAAQPGETARILVYGLVGLGEAWVEDTGIVAQMRVGMEGIFLPVPVALGEMVSYGGSSLNLSGFASYRLADGMHFVILDATDGLVYAEWAYRGMDATSLDAAEASIRSRLDMIEHAGEYPPTDFDRISAEQTYGELRKVTGSQAEFTYFLEEEGVYTGEMDSLMDRTFWYEDNRYYYFFSCTWDDTYGALVAQVEKTP